MKRRTLLACAAAACAAMLIAAERRVDPTYVHRYLPELRDGATDMAGQGVHYKPVFGAGDADRSIPRGLARYGELVLDPGAASAVIETPGEEQVYVVLEGSGSLQHGSAKHALRKGDFLYLPPAIKRSVANPGVQRCRMIVMGFRVPKSSAGNTPEKLAIANLDTVKKQVVGNHPASTLYQLMIGDTNSTRDAIAAGRTLTSLYVMEFAPGGTNFPHHHETEEEAYLLLDGRGEMVAGGGMDGVEGRHPARAGDAYFFRLNCTVGFYNGSSGPAHILAARWRFPFRGGAQ